MAVGLNAVREVARRNPLALGEDLLQDLVQYKKHIDRGVTMAAKGIMQGEFFSDDALDDPTKPNDLNIILQPRF